MHSKEPISNMFLKNEKFLLESHKCERTESNERSILTWCLFSVFSHDSKSERSFTIPFSRTKRTTLLSVQRINKVT